MREAVVKFAEAMEAKLATEDAQHPQGWQGGAPELLLARLEERLDAVHYGILKGAISADAIRGKLVDVANFAMMLHDVIGRTASAIEGDVLS